MTMLDLVLEGEMEYGTAAGAGDENHELGDIDEMADLDIGEPTWVLLERLGVR